MQRISIFILIQFFTGIISSQNLIPNGDFEEYIGCPTNIGQIDSASYWFQPTSGTSDYYNKCASPDYVGVPFHSTGYQPAHSGDGYGGFGLVSNISNYREYIEIQLKESLIPNTNYHLEFYINLINNYRYTCDAIGAYFSNSIVTASSSGVLLVTPQVINPIGNYPDTLNWMLISGTYKAKGGENYLTIGNFKDDMNSSVIIFDSTSNIEAAYVLIDDVSLSTTTNTRIQNDISNLKIYPNPVQEKLICSGLPQPAELKLFDISAKLVLFKKLTSGDNIINISKINSGFYFYEITNNRLVKKGKIIKR